MIFELMITIVIFSILLVGTMTSTSLLSKVKVSRTAISLYEFVNYAKIAALATKVEHTVQVEGQTLTLRTHQGIQKTMRLLDGVEVSWNRSSEMGFSKQGRSLLPGTFTVTDAAKRYTKKISVSQTLSKVTLK